MTSRVETLQQLQQQVRRVQQPTTQTDHELLSTGFPALDRLLPSNGLRQGVLTEWFSRNQGSGAATLSLNVARQICRAGGALIIIDRQRNIYPPAIAAWGIALDNVFWLQPANAQDEFWAWDQSLRCSAVAAVWGYLKQITPRSFRRLQLSAETSGVMGFLLRPHAARHQPSWADVSFAVEAEATTSGRRLRVELLRCRGTARRSQVRIHFDEWTDQSHEVNHEHETHSRTLAAQLARTETSNRSARVSRSRRIAL